jgi:hypothetical protein
MKISNDTDPARAAWRKSRRSGGGNQCVEVARVDARCAVRDSKNPDGYLAFSMTAFAAFAARIKHGDFAV